MSRGSAGHATYVLYYAGLECTRVVWVSRAMFLTEGLHSRFILVKVRSLIGTLNATKAHQPNRLI